MRSLKGSEAECVVLGQVVDTEGILLPSVLTAALGARPRRYLATKFDVDG